MAFAKKTWKDRIAEFPTRRRLTKEDNTSELVTVAREEGTLSQEGDAFSAENMNDLESRIDAEFTEVNGKLLKYDKDKISVNKPNIAIGTNIIDGTAFTLSKGIYFITVKVQGISAITRNDQRIEFWVGNAKSRLISQVVLPHNTPYPIVTFASFANVIDEDTFNVYSYVDITTLSLFSVDIEIVKLLG